MLNINFMGFLDRFVFEVVMRKSYWLAAAALAAVWVIGQTVHFAPPTMISTAGYLALAITAVGIVSVVILFVANIIESITIGKDDC